MRRLMVLGGTSGIGQAFTDLARKESALFDRVAPYGIEDFDVSQVYPVITKISNFQPTDVLYSVGINKLDWIGDISRATFDRVMSVNVFGFINVMRALQIECEHPVNVVAVTSDAAWRPMRTSAVYCASKAALEMAVRVASRETAPQGWRVNAVAPGKVLDTPMTEYVDARVLKLRGWTPEFAAEYERNSSPIGRAVTKQEVAEVILHVLNGPKAQTGEIITVNGGR